MRYSLFFPLIGLAACGLDYEVIPDGDPVDTDPNVDDVIDTDEEPPGDRPVAVCSVTPDAVEPPFETSRFIGDDSYDPAGHAITRYTWTIIEAPEGSAATLGGTNADPTRLFTADLAGTYVGRLVVTTDDDRSSLPCEASLDAIPSQDFWVEMYWTFSGDDMDLHLLAPGGSLTGSTDCYYGNCTGGGPNWGTPGPADDPALDLDDIPGTGPENINIAEPQTGVFKVIVHDYPSSVHNGTNPTTVNIYTGGSLVWSDTRDMNVSEGTYVYFAKVDWPSGDVLDCPDNGC